MTVVYRQNKAAMRLLFTGKTRQRSESCLQAKQGSDVAVVDISMPYESTFFSNSNSFIEIFQLEIKIQNSYISDVEIRTTWHVYIHAESTFK